VRLAREPAVPRQEPEQSDLLLGREQLPPNLNRRCRRLHRYFLARRWTPCPPDEEASAAATRSQYHARSGNLARVDGRDARKREADCICDIATTWGQEDPLIRAVGLAGSYARGTPRADSDVDLIVLTEEPSHLLDHDEWHSRFGDVELVRSETFGVLVERRLRLATGLDIEVGVVPTSWAGIDPIDAGTRRVVKEGFHVLYDRDGLLTALVESVSRSRA